MKTVKLGLVDAGWKQRAVYEFCRRLVPPVWRPARGSANGVTGKYMAPRSTNGIKNVGRGHHEAYQRADSIWLTWLDADRFKQQVQEGFRIENVEAVGSISLYGSDAAKHQAFAEQICDEQWDVDKERFLAYGGRRARNNHWLDCVAMAAGAATILGISVVGESKKIRRISLSEIQQQKRLAR